MRAMSEPQRFAGDRVFQVGVLDRGIEYFPQDLVDDRALFGADAALGQQRQGG
jgi:hypothetical protein